MGWLLAARWIVIGRVVDEIGVGKEWQRAAVYVAILSVPGSGLCGLSLPAASRIGDVWVGESCGGLGIDEIGIKGLRSEEAEEHFHVRSGAERVALQANAGDRKVVVGVGPVSGVTEESPFEGAILIGQQGIERVGELVSGGVKPGFR